MTETHSRRQAFKKFIASRDGNSMWNRIHAMARHYASVHVMQLDPNWHSLRIGFDDTSVLHSRIFDDRPLTDKDACRVEFDYRPLEFTLIGPRVGHMDLTAQAFDVIPEPIVMLMRALDVMAKTYHWIDNPKHAIELIEGKTIIEFENGVQGVVRNVRGHGKEFDVECFPRFRDRVEFRHYTFERLLEEMKMDALHAQASDVDYFPLLPLEGMPRATVDDYEAAELAMAPVYQAQYEAERARQEVEEATREAAMSPEERAKRDARRARAAAQAGIIHALMPVLPRPGE